MDKPNGVYIGNKSIGSIYNREDNAFTEVLIERDSLFEDGCDYCYSIETNEEQELPGKVIDPEISLAYRCYYELKKNNSQQKRVYEIICNNQSISSYSVVDIEKQSASIEFSQEYSDFNQDDQDIIILEYFAGLLEMRYPDSETARNMIDIIDEVKGQIINGQKDDISGKGHQCIEILSSVNGKEPDIDFKLDDIDISLSRQSIEEHLRKELSIEYLSAIKSLIHNLTLNFSRDDVIYIYTDIPNFSVTYMKELEHISELNHVKIVAIDERMKAIAQGNAYYYYLLNSGFSEKIKEGIGRFVLSYNERKYLIENEEGSMDIFLDDDFQENPTLIIFDKKKKKKKPLRLELPFFCTGNCIAIDYACKTTSIVLKAEQELTGISTIFEVNY
jgi:hypothetical protein